MAQVGSPRAAFATVLAVALLAVVSAAAAQGWAGLRRVSLAVDVRHPVDTLSEEGLLARLEDGVRRAEPALGVSEGLTDRLRLVVSVRPVGATTLRGSSIQKNPKETDRKSVV